MITDYDFDLMIITPGQIRAARALLRMEQDELARRAHLSPIAIRSLEANDLPTDKSAGTLDGIRHVLEQAGAEFIPGGVRKRPTMPVDPDAMFADLRAISIRSAARLRDQGELDRITLYDEDGLPG